VNVSGSPEADIAVNANAALNDRIGNLFISISLSI
jgi:hypothetical protein